MKLWNNFFFYYSIIYLYEFSERKKERSLSSPLYQKMTKIFCHAYSEN